uniref:Transcription termination and cleavage factor C-terminal domain-containing protein n=3 Tax=Aegilops tauschii subsp. strangulata TaxID=200361 RepID=A0A452ZJG6_AEGTS
TGLKLAARIALPGLRPNRRRTGSGRSPAPARAMTANQPAGEALATHISGMSRPEMYDLMSQMKAMLDHDQERVRRMLVQNPDVTRALFRAQVVLGMVKTPKAAQSSDTPQPAAAQTTPPASVKATVQDHVNLPQPPLPTNQQNLQPSGQFPLGASNVTSSLDLPPMPANPPQSAQSKGYPIHQMHSASAPQSSQYPNVTMPPHAPPQYSNVPSHMPTVNSQPQQPLQNPGMFNQQLQPPLPQLPRPPSMQAYTHQMHQQIPSTYGQHMLQQPMFHPGGNPQNSFFTGQQQQQLPNQPPPLPNQPPPQLYQANSHVSSHYNSQSMQVDRSAPWGRGNQEASSAGSHFPGQFQGLPGQMTQGIGGMQTGRLEAPLTADMEKMLVQQVMSMSPEQINALPPEQRQQVLQLRDMLRQ